MFAMRTDLIIFDLDGVLIDSEIVWHKVCALYLTRLGYPLTVEQSMELFSAHNRMTFDEALLQKFGVELSQKDKAAINDNTESAYPDQLQPVANVDKVLEYLTTKQVPFCVASNADKQYIESTLTDTRLMRYFASEHLFGTDERTRRKPAPDVFLKAARHFNIEPSRCLVIEDHALGIEAAHQAHMPSVGFLGACHAGTEAHRQWLSGPDPLAIIHNADELGSFLRQYFD